ncbi:hypothetical protein P885DRAFT_74387 [Corynascus similis CBS 632.67]
MPPAARNQPRVAAAAAAAAAVPAPAPAEVATPSDSPSRSLHLNFPREPQPQQLEEFPSEPTQTVITVPAHYGSLSSGPSPGTVAGITLGSVAGFVLLLWLVYTCINLGNPNSGATNDTSTVVTEGTGSVYLRRRHRSRSRTGRSRQHSRRRTSGITKETVEIRTRGSAGGRGIIVEDSTTASSLGPSQMSEVDRVIIEERRRSVSRHGGGRRASIPPPRRGPLSSDGEEDEVVVIEEHSPPRRRHRSRVRSVERRSSGYREVDPDRFAGGDAEFVEVRRSGSRR